MVTELTAELVVDAHATLGEGPVWDDVARVLWWVDIEGRRVHRYDPLLDVDRPFLAPSMVGTVGLRRDGAGLVAGLADGAWLVDTPADGSEPLAGDWRPLVRFIEDDDTRCNDGKPDPAGRFVVGTKAPEGVDGASRLFSVEPSGEVRTIVDGLGMSNGLAWTGDGATMYLADTLARRIEAWVYDVASGSVGERRTVVVLGEGDGVPDGLTIDAEGHLWVGCFGGGAVRRFAPDGRLEALVRVPAAQVTSCAFGGPDLGDLYITTATSGLDEAALAGQPAAGGLFRVRPGATGVPALRFGA